MGLTRFRQEFSGRSRAIDSAGCPTPRHSRPEDEIKSLTDFTNRDRRLGGGG
jgi:hypothetical protein